jgi:Rps23 Pro-64 3,4-dihydroxylase Tpa1-like proline 4-hydroxylase
MMLQPLDREALRRQYVEAKPFPFVKIENFLNPGFANEIAAAFPTFEYAAEHGTTFASVNERRKIQITDPERFSEPVKRLNEALASSGFLSDLSYITGISNLLADEQLVGGGVHITGPGGRLDVHVDFNYIKERKLHRRLNLLIYLNPVWQEQWGGEIQLWDKDVKHCIQAFAPAINRCVVFETSDISFHGVTPISPLAPFPRQSFATYYYTREAPPNWSGVSHGTIFKARPDEKLRSFMLMPAENLKQRIIHGADQVKRGVKKLMSGR